MSVSLALNGGGPEGRDEILREKQREIESLQKYLEDKTDYRAKFEALVHFLQRSLDSEDVGEDEGQFLRDEDTDRKIQVICEKFGNYRLEVGERLL